MSEYVSIHASSPSTSMSWVPRKCVVEGKCSTPEMNSISSSASVNSRGPYDAWNDDAKQLRMRS